MATSMPGRQGSGAGAGPGLRPRPLAFGRARWYSGAVRGRGAGAALALAGAVLALGGLPGAAKAVALGDGKVVTSSPRPDSAGAGPAQPVRPTERHGRHAPALRPAASPPRAWGAERRSPGRQAAGPATAR